MCADMRNKIIFLMVFLLILIILIKQDNNQKYVVVSVHDVHPVNTDELKIIFSELDRLDIKKTILVTPYLDNEDINEDKIFIELIQREREKGAEIALHGYTHKRDEFSKSYEEVKDNLEKGMDIFHKAFGFYPKGFVPGYWKQNKDTINALEDLNFEYTTTFTKIIYFNHKEIKTLPIGMYGSNKFFAFLTKICSIVYVNLKKKNVLRFTIHPGEVRFNIFDDSIILLNNVLDKGYIPVTYEELKTIDLNR